ncbi:MAG: tRNA (adenosine(37)-N6)-threonylcarbamoyltransferase complex ATPase subunit type 1 TsaE [Phycisphaerales bacterium]|nr:tRNA (adenosine(37)-N6)-threonylcarbamoyltransferase complex ATPase subunit type 1 TsaE [Phycisphaerales bacterium]
MVVTRSVGETLDLGARIGSALSPGSVIALVGTLGSGKTHFVKGVARGNATPASVPVTSPTFVLINEYPGRLPLYHIDTYRLRGADDLDALGFDEMVKGDGAVLVEWADRVRELLPADHLHVSIEITGETERTISLTAHGPSAEAVLRTLGC